MPDTSKIFELIKEHDVKYVDLRFTDPRGKLQHVSQHVSTIDEDVFEHGLQFDGSSIAGWKAINESDMTLIPDVETAVMDPFAAQPTLNILCDIYEPSTGQPYNRDPRSIAKAAEAYALSIGIADTVYFGPEAEFFVFDDVRFSVGMNEASLRGRFDREPAQFRQGLRRGQSRPPAGGQGRLFSGGADR